MPTLNVANRSLSGKRGPGNLKSPRSLKSPKQVKVTRDVEYLNRFINCADPGKDAKEETFTRTLTTTSISNKTIVCVIFYHNEHQKEVAEKYKHKLIEAKAWDKPIITEITAFTKFYSAESYHQNYYNDNTNQGYCRYVIGPKLEKFEKVFANKLKKVQE